MKRTAMMIALLWLALPSAAQVVASAGERLLVATTRATTLVDGRGNVVWKGEGIRTPGAIAVGETRAAILDPLRNEATIFDLRDGRRRVVSTAETPVVAMYRGDDLFILARDGGKLEKVAGDGTRSWVETGLDPAFIRRAGTALVVYSRVDGKLQVIDPGTMRVMRSASAGPFASDLEVDGSTVYLLYPRSAMLAEWDLATLASAGEINVGAVPVDAAFTRGSNALSATTIAVADPAARRVWMIEGRQSMAEAIGRGFLRGLIGLGLFRSNGREFPTGVDRVFARGRQWIGYDTSSGTLYRIDRKSVVRLATGVAPGAFALTEGGLAWLEGDVVKRTRL